MDKILKLKKLIEDSNNIVFFGGAGVSTESNIPDFRSVDGLYSLKYKYPPEEILSHTFFMNKTEEFYSFYRDKIIHEEALPNKAHIALAKLEEMGKLTMVVTQNIDGLHQMAGSKNVCEIHGSINKNYCLDCGSKYDLKYILDQESVIPKCEKCGGTIRPDVVLYQEGLDNEVIKNAVKAISESDLLIVGGSSLLVYPAAGFVRYHKKGNLVMINKSETPYDGNAKLIINEKIGEVLDSVLKCD